MYQLLSIFCCRNLHYLRRAVKSGYSLITVASVNNRMLIVLLCERYFTFVELLTCFVAKRAIVSGCDIAVVVHRKLFDSVFNLPVGTVRN